MRCGRCGRELPENALFCESCGARVAANTRYYGGKQNGSMKRKRTTSGDSKKYVILIVIPILVVFGIAAMVGGYFIYRKTDGSKYTPANGGSAGTFVTVATEAPAAPTAAPTAQPITDGATQVDSGAGKLDTYYVVNCEKSISLRESPSTSAKVLREIPLGSPVSFVEAAKDGFAKIIYNGTTGYALQSYLSETAPNIDSRPNTPPQQDERGEPPADDGRGAENTVGAISNPAYKTYTSSSFRFTCAYPSHFNVYNDSDKFVLYSVKAPDNTAAVKICGSVNSSGLSVTNVLNNFISSYPGSVDYKDSGDVWCAVRTIADGKCHYGYFHVEDGMIRGFEMHYDSSYYSTYDNYVNDIYSSIVFK